MNQFESLESRVLFSSTGIASTNVVIDAASSSSSIEGYTPSQIAKAYDFDDITFDDGAIKGDGSGQTIAIVDAYNDPDIRSDLATFDSEFGIAAPTSFRVVNQFGGSSLPATNAGWATEISLDVEWAHAMAPGAKIVLVEADSATISSLMSAVNYARHLSGVSVVSMSWGGSEFFSWNGSGQSETDYDDIFTTPSGHKGVTFIAAAGDSGQAEGVDWPSASPNVVSVGGTSLYTSDSSGTYEDETGWSGTSGGYSQVEAEPTYQYVAQDTGARSTPDVSYDADPDTGFAVYDSLDYEGYVGWQEVGGTSAGAPQWSALIAIADQGRALEGLSSLDGSTQTLPALYDLYSAPGTSGYSTYTSYFNDVDSGGGEFHWPFGGYGYSGNATEGYDTVTGLGSPKADALVSAMLDVANNSATTITPSDTTSSLSGSYFKTSPAAQVAVGTTGSLRLVLTNASSATFTGPVTVTLYAATGTSLSTDAVTIKSFTLHHVTIAAGKSVTQTLTYKYRNDLAGGTYYIIGEIETPGADAVATDAVTSGTVTVESPAVAHARANADRAVATSSSVQNTLEATVENDLYLGTWSGKGVAGATAFLGRTDRD